MGVLAFCLFLFGVGIVAVVGLAHEVVSLFGKAVNEVIQRLLGLSGSCLTAVGARTKSGLVHHRTWRIANFLSLEGGLIDSLLGILCLIVAMVGELAIHAGAAALRG